MIPHREVSGTISVFSQSPDSSGFCETKPIQTFSLQSEPGQWIPGVEARKQGVGASAETTKLHKPERGQSLTRANAGGSREWVS